MNQYSLFRISTFGCIALLLCMYSWPATATVWQIGAARSLKLPSQAVPLVRDGDTVDIDAGSYVDCATWTKNNLLLRGIGGFAHLHDKACAGKAIWIIQGNNTTMEWIEFSGASVVDKNGAGIRMEGTNLTVRHCFFHDNEDGILAGDNANSTILIEYTEFANNGYGDGFSHNMYINHVARFTLQYCYTHHAKVGHDVKSRAFQTFILYNRISDESTGTASRCIDIPNGGLAVILGNLIHHGPNTQNSNTFGYGLEGLSNPVKVLAVSQNTFVSERPAGSFIQIPAAGTDTVLMFNNLFVGSGPILSGNATLIDSAANLKFTSTTMAGLLDPSRYDYRLLPSSPAIDAGISPGNTNGFALLPDHEYIHPSDGRVRSILNRPDVGAYEYHPGTEVRTTTVPSPAAIHLFDSYPNPFAMITTIPYSVAAGRPKPGRVSVHISDMLGRRIVSFPEIDTAPGMHTLRFDARHFNLSPGMYTCALIGNEQHQVTLLLLVR